MKKYFAEKLLPGDVKKYYKANKRSLSDVLRFLNDNYDLNLIEDENFVLFYSYIEIECAIKIFVDDVGKVLEKVGPKIRRMPETENIRLFLAEFEKLEKQEARRRKRLAKLLSMDFDSLELDQKKDVAYELSDSKDLNSKSIAAQYFLKIYHETKTMHYFNNYASMLYKSGQKEKALEEYEKIIQWYQTSEYFDRGRVISGIYADQMDFFKSDKEKFRAIWDLAKADVYANQWEFPGYWVYTVEFAKISLAYGYFDICNDLLENIKKHKLPIPQTIKEHYGL